MHLLADILKLGKPLEFDKRETHSFNEWLKLTRFKPIKRDENNTIESIEAETLKLLRTTYETQKI